MAAQPVSDFEVAPEVFEEHVVPGQSNVNDLDDPNSTTSYDEESDSIGTKSKPIGRALFRHGGTFPTAICLSKAAIGAGVLSMSAHCAEVGFAWQVAALALGAVLTLTSIRMISRVSICTGCYSYENICDELLHPAASLFTGIINVCNCLGSGAGYLIVCGQVFQVICGATDYDRRIFILLCGIFVCGPLALARHVSFMRHLAAGSVVALLILVAAVIWYWGEFGTDDTISSEVLVFGPGGATAITYMNSINNIVFAYNNQFNVPQLTGELTPLPTTHKMTVVSVMTVVLCFTLFTGVSLFGVLAFGVGENQRDSLVVDLTPARKNPLVLISLVAVMFSVLTCFQFHIYPIRQFAAYAVRKARGRAIDDEGADAMFCGRSLTRWFDVASALLSVGLIILIAVVVSSLKTILDFVGAFASAYISYVIPSIWIIQMLRKSKGFSWIAVDTIGAVMLLLIGLFFFLFGTYSAISGAIQS